MADRITTMNISLPSSLREYIAERMDLGGFANASEYIRHLIREDMQRNSEQLRALIEEGLRSGPGTEMTAARRAALRERLAAKHTRRKKSA